MRQNNAICAKKDKGTYRNNAKRPTLELQNNTFFENQKK